MKKLLMFTIALLILVLNLCDCYKLLVVFPMPGKSHSILGEGYVRHLLNAGHEVTYITPLPVKNPPSNLRQIDVSSNFDIFAADEFLDIKRILAKENDVSDLSIILSMMYGLTNYTIFHDNVQKLLHDTNETFDAVIAEWMYSELYSGFASVFNCPLIWSSSMEPHDMVLSLIDESPNPAYTADHMSSNVPPFTFLQRIEELWKIIKIKFYRMLMSTLEQQTFNAGYRLAAARRGHKLPLFNEAKYNASLMLGNSHVSCGQPLPLPQNYIPIAGYHIKEQVSPLPQDLQKIMDNSEHGVIYFSLGSMLKAHSMPDELKIQLKNMFGGLKQTIIWKFEEKLDDLPKNLHLVTWAPQPSILAHPKCILFITHGGLLSTTETLHYGVPTIGIPMFADQFVNVNRAVIKGFAQRVDFDYDIATNLKIAIQDVITNPRYRERVKELSAIYHDRPVSPGKELVHWVEHVVRTRGALHLRSPALHVPWYQKTYLDLTALTLIILIIVIVLVKYVLRSRSNVNVEKKNS